MNKISTWKETSGTELRITCFRNFYMVGKVFRGILYYKKNGFAFVKPIDENGGFIQGIEDIFIPPNSIGGACDGDIVKCSSDYYKEFINASNEKKASKRKMASVARTPVRNRGKVMSIIEHDNRPVTGIVTDISSGKVYIFTDNFLPGKILVTVPDKNIRNIRVGDKLVVNEFKYNKQTDNYKAKLVKNLGYSEDFFVNRKSVSISLDIETPVSDEAMAEASRISAIPISKYISKRQDLRGKLLFTIDDGSDRQRDTAFSITRNADGDYVFGLHTADIAEVIPLGSELDRASFARGRSCQLPDSYYPMMPDKEIKRNITFEKGKDRLAVSVFVTYDANGDVKDVSFCESIVNILINCEHKELDALLISNDTSSVLQLRKKYGVVQKELDDFYTLGSILQSKFNNSVRVHDHGEKVFVCDSDGLPEKVKYINDNDPNRISRLIILAVAEALGKYLYEKNVPLIYTGQDIPPEDALIEMRSAASAFGLDSTSVSDGDLPAFIASALDILPDKKMLSWLLTVSEPSSYYALAPKAHCYNGTQFYAPLVGPTNDYAALTNQRVLKTVVAKGYEATGEEITSGENAARASLLATELTLKEKKIVRAFVLSDKLYSAECVRQTVDKSFDGFVFDISTTGISLFLQDFGTDGMIYFDTDESIIIDTATKTATYKGCDYKIGDIVPVKLSRVSYAERRMYLSRDTKSQ